MGRFDYDIGIIGGGAAGLTVAAGAGKLGARALLIENRRNLGGDCLNFGCVPSKALIRAAALRHASSLGPTFGLPASAGEPVDLAAVLARVRKVIEEIGVNDSPERFTAMGVQVVFASPSFTDPHEVRWEGGSATARRWVVATGSSPALPPIEGLAEAPYLTNETIFSLTKLPASLAILGGGPIGLELGQAFARLGSSVTVIELLDELFGNDDREIGRLISRRLTAEGVTLLTGHRAVRVLNLADGSVELTLSDSTGGTEKTIRADALLVAAGRRPNTAGLGLENAGVEVARGGLSTDARMRTNVRHIYACGDVTGKQLFTHVAGAQGKVVVANALLGVPRKFDPKLVGWCVYTSPEVAGVGLGEEEALKLGLDFTVVKSPLSQCDRAVIDGDDGGFVKLLVGRRGKLLGCRIVSKRAGESVHEWLQAAKQGLPLSAVASLIHVYPTYGELNARAAGSYLERTLDKPLVRALLKFVYGYSRKP